MIEGLLISILFSCLVVNLVAYIRFGRFAQQWKRKAEQQLRNMAYDRENASADLERVYWSRHYLKRHEKN